MAKSGNCAKCGKQTSFFEREGKMFCSEKCCYEFFTIDEPRREEEEEEVSLERWEEIEDEIFFLTKKRNRFGLSEKDLEEVKSLQLEINSIIEKIISTMKKENKKSAKYFELKLRKSSIKNNLRDLKWWEEDPDPNDKKANKDLFAQLKDEIKLLKERIDELESKSNLTNKEKGWLKRNKQKLSKLEQEILQNPSSLSSKETSDKPFNYLPWLVGGGILAIIIILLFFLMSGKPKKFKSE